MSCESVIIPGSKIALVGEAPGQQEDLLGRPFVGPAGQELTSMLDQAGIDIRECSLLNCFNERPPQNQIEKFCGKKAECGAGYSLPPLRQGKYFLPKYLHHIERLRMELDALRPNLVIALGNTACWALLGTSGIMRHRGTVTSGACTSKVLPTYHPAAVLRQWELRPVTVMDFLKARREAEFPEIVRPRRELWLEPTLEDLEQFFSQHLVQAREIAFDIETAFGQITCISFAPTPSLALVIPFVDRTKPDRSYWDAPSERKAWDFVRRVLALPASKITQNGLYDMQWLWRLMGMHPQGDLHDTMLLHHAMYPELEKGLGFLGSVYTNEAAWKLLRGKLNETTKRDDE